MRAITGTPSARRIGPRRRSRIGNHESETKTTIPRTQIMRQHTHREDRRRPIWRAPVRLATSSLKIGLKRIRRNSSNDCRHRAPDNCEGEHVT